MNAPILYKKILSIKEEDKVISEAYIDQELELQLIWTYPQYRRKGYGEKMFLKILDWMKSNKTRRMKFLNSNQLFWSKMLEKYPRHLKLLNMDGWILL